MSIEKCLTPNCTRVSAPSLERGLCLLCYSKAKKLVAAGTTTWSELVRMGLANPTSKESIDPFTAAFNKSKSDMGDADASGK